MGLEDINLKELIEHETGERFNREGFISCPFHNEKTPSLSVKYIEKAGKERFHCWGCGAKGDAVDFITSYKVMNNVQACEYLNIKIDGIKGIEKPDEGILGYINWQLNNTKKGWTYLNELYAFKDKDNEIAYFKAKFKDENGKKQIRYYHYEDGKVKSVMGEDRENIPYNFYNVLKGIREDKIIILVEGEKDVDNLSRILGPNYVVTSTKGCSDLDVIVEKDIRYWICGDTGLAGERYVKKAVSALYQFASELRVINLPGLKDLGDNKDVSDWLKLGNNKRDFLNAANRSLDLKSDYELQQDSFGIYKKVSNKNNDNLRNVYLTNFKLLEAKRMKFVDEDIEGVKMIMQSPTGATIEKIGPATIFDEARTFRNFLGTMDLAFRGKTEDLITLKEWINKYFAIDVEETYTGVKFMANKDNLMLVTKDGSLTKDGLDLKIKTDNKNNIEIVDVENISKEELIELKKYLFSFAAADKTIPIIGTIINNMLVYQNEQCNFTLHHLLIVGESGSGKSKTLENIIAQILNYPLNEIRALGQITPFALTKVLTEGNYTALFEEFKPSYWDRYKVQSLSETLRNLYTRGVVSRSGKSLQLREFQYSRPIVMVGEESFPNSEQAQVERSCIVYLSKMERTDKTTESYKWLEKNPGVLNKFGKSLIEIALNITVEEYREMFYKCEKKFDKELKDRLLSTATNIAMGIEMINILMAKHGMKKLIGYEKYILKNINEELLEGESETRSIVEQMLIMFDYLIECGRVNRNITVQYKFGKLYISTSALIDEIFKYIKDIGSAEIVPIKIRDFRKQCKKSGYIISSDTVQQSFGEIRKRCDEYNPERIRKLNLTNIIDVIHVIEGLGEAEKVDQINVFKDDAVPF
ncbi:MAG: CHC2 zinc finger domain-containing protein [Filifactoraceae bacterium]